MQGLGWPYIERTTFNERGISNCMPVSTENSTKHEALRLQNNVTLSSNVKKKCTATVILITEYMISFIFVKLIYC